ncbi:hypothetical protein ACS0TY_030897 [Phlomoides rotata]
MEQVEGWGGFVIKEKLKRLKADIKQWNREVFGMMDAKIEARKQEINKLDIIDEVMGLDEQEISRRNEERVNLFHDMKCKDNILLQKARCKWIKEGDANTRFFHKYINKRRKRNEITGVRIEGEWKEEVEEGGNDEWRWNRARDDIYSTKMAYDWLLGNKDVTQHMERRKFKLIWNKLVSSKIQVHAWRVIRERVPTTTNLQRRNVLPQNANINCSFCDSNLETDSKRVEREGYSSLYLGMHDLEYMESKERIYL